MDSKEKNYSHDWIHKLEGPYHWQLYWNQLDLAINKSKITKDDTIAEIGVGSGFTSNYLKRKGFSVTTIDIDPNKSPDIVADITKSTLPRADMYLAFEIFEHISYEEVTRVWDELSKKEVKYLVFSIPYAYRVYLWLQYWSPYFEWGSFTLGRKRNHINSKHHHWEIGINNISVKKIMSQLYEVGYLTSINYRYRNHHFFLASLENPQKNEQKGQ